MKLRNPIISLMALLSNAGAAQAACVSSDDLTNGIIVTYDEGTVEIHRQAGENQVSVEQVVGDEVIQTWILAKGVYNIQTIVWVEGRELSEHSYSIDFDVSPSDMPLPKPGDTWETHSVFQSVSDGTLRQKIVYEYSKLRTLEIGPCFFKAILVEERLPDIEIPNTLGSLYLPELGMSIHVETNGRRVRNPVSLVAVGR